MSRQQSVDSGGRWTNGNSCDSNKVRGIISDRAAGGLSRMLHHCNLGILGASYCTTPKTDTWYIPSCWAGRGLSALDVHDDPDTVLSSRELLDLGSRSHHMSSTVTLGIIIPAALAFVNTFTACPSAIRRTTQLTDQSPRPRATTNLLVHGCIDHSPI